MVNKSTLFLTGFEPDLLTRPRRLIWRCGLVCFILHTLMYLFFTYIGKPNNATVTYFLKFMSIYCLLLIKLHVPFATKLCVLNYVPKCQMSSGP